MSYQSLKGSIFVECFSVLPEILQQVLSWQSLVKKKRERDPYILFHQYFSAFICLFNSNTYLSTSI